MPSISPWIQIRLEIMDINWKSKHTMNTLGNTFNYRVVKIWNSLPSEVVASESVGTFKSRLDGVFKNSFEIDWNCRL